MRIALALVALVVSLPFRAEADPARAWAAAKANLPASTASMLGLDVDKVTGSSMFSLALPLLLAQEKDIKAAFDVLKTGCGMDPLKVVDGLVAAFDKEQKAGAIFVSLDGVDEAKLVACASVVAKQHDPKNPGVAATKDGAITELAHGGKKIYLAWIGTDVIALPYTLEDKAMLQAWTAGKGAFAKSPVGKLAAKADTRAALWVASNVEREVERKKMKSAYGSIELAGAKVRADAHLTFAAAADAKEVAKRANDEVTKLMMNGGLDASLIEALKKFSITSAGAELVAKGTLAESDLMSLAGGAMGGF